MKVNPLIYTKKKSVRFYFKISGYFVCLWLNCFGITHICYLSTVEIPNTKNEHSLSGTVVKCFNRSRDCLGTID